MIVGSPRKRLLIALAFLLPNLLGFLVFTAGPMLGSFWMSLTDLQLTKHNVYSDTPVQFVGFSNYSEILAGAESGRFWPYFANTLYLMLGIPLGIAGSLGLALLITAKITPTRHGNRLRLAALVAGLTLIASVLVWMLFAPAADSAAASALSTEPGLTDLSTMQVDRLRATAATLATLGVGVIAIVGLLTGSVFFRTAYYLPSLLAGVPMYLLWKTLYRPDGGVVNAIVDPLIDATHAAVLSTPAPLWQAGAIVTLLLAGGLVIRVLTHAIRGFTEGEIGWVALSGRLCILAVAVAVLLGIAQVLHGLPDAAVNAARLGLDGFEPPEWLVSSTWAKPALVIMGVWLGVGGANMLLYIAGLSNIPPELYEAADLDGAVGWQRFANITWPQLAPTTFFIVIMSTIGGLQGGFEQALIMTAGLYDTTVLTYYIYNLAFADEFRLGMASAVAWIMFAMIFVLTVINYRLGSRLTND